MLGSLGVPLVAISLVLAVENTWYQYLPFLFILWGIAFTLFQVSSLPYIMRNTVAKNQSHAISLNYATHSFGTIISGIMIFGFGKFMKEINEGVILLFIAFLGFFGVYYLLKMKVDMVVPFKKEFKWRSYDWALLLLSLIHI